MRLSANWSFTETGVFLWHMQSHSVPVSRQGKYLDYHFVDLETGVPGGTEAYPALTQESETKGSWESSLRQTL